MSQDALVVRPPPSAAGLEVAEFAVPANPGVGSVSFATDRKIHLLWLVTTTGGAGDAFNVNNDGNTLAGAGLETIRPDDQGYHYAETLILAERTVLAGNLIEATLTGAQTAQCFLLHGPA